MDKKLTVSLAIIAKDEDAQLIRIIETYHGYFDAIHIAYDGIAEQLDMRLATKFDNGETGCIMSKVKIHQYEWCNDFAHKRNWLNEKIDTDYYVRMDTDDELIGAENIAYMIGRMEETGTDIVLCNYRYYNDDSGNAELAHNRETIIKNDPKLYWKGRIHETVVCDDANNVAFYNDEEGKVEIVHMADEGHQFRSVSRNIIILKDEYQKNGDDTDPRIIAYLGRSYSDLEEYEEAIPLLHTHIEKSGWDEDRYISHLYLAKCYMKIGKDTESVNEAMKAIQERPDYPAAYGHLCQYYFDKENYNWAIQYGEMCLTKEQPQTNMGYDPSLLTWKVPFFLSLCYLHENKHEKAVLMFADAKKVAPNSPDVQRATPIFLKAAAHYDYLRHFIKVMKFTKQAGGDMLSLVRSIPPELSGHEMVENLKHKYLPSKTWSDNSVVIYCGNTANTWSPEDTQTGVGGSEEACIHLSRELAKLGYEVTVYANIPQTSYDDNGVSYLPFVEFNRFDSFNTLVGWRQNMTQHSIKAKKHVYWIHDLPNKKQLLEKNIKELDTVVVLSEYHKTLLPDYVEKECNVVVSTNGINPDDFKDIEVVKKPKRIIYASSYDRGLETILKSWDYIKQCEPEAELHIYYGWQTYDKYVTMRLASQEWKEKMLELMDQDGVYEHGRVGHKELVKEYAKASVFAYPCIYSGEINCIALTKAIATNCNIITNDFAVLAERSPNAVSDELFINKVVEELSKETKNELNDEYITSMSWANVALDWQKRVL